MATTDATGQRFLSRLKRRPCYGGLDLAAVSDLTAFVLIWPVRSFVYLYPWVFLPGDDLAERCRKDNVRYDQWARDGYLELTPGAVTDWIYVTDRIIQLSQIFDIRQIGYDRAGARDVVTRLGEASIDCADWGQGFMSMSAPSKRLESLVLSRHLVHTGHPLMRWCVDCTTIATDAAGNIKPVKPDRMKSSKRIDPVVAAVNALGVWMKQEGNGYADLTTMVIG